uniref:Uncharacterized protein LOC100372012 n=1 Tax=Saccoglossus kowalevskii TaxID=10224 RepID=A0ABM0M3H6_SACKO|nr:PREDICTED: uncharacterized protein LOC100372012 [Saccoglossus kowalevskii]
MPLTLERRRKEDKEDKKKEKERKKEEKKEKKKYKTKNEEFMDKKIDELSKQLVEEKQNTRREKLAVARLHRELTTAKSELPSRESLMKDLMQERELRLEAEKRLLEMTKESETCRTRLETLQEEFDKMEEAVKGMLQYKTKIEQLKIEKSNFILAYENNLQKYRTHISNLEKENTSLMTEFQNRETTVSVAETIIAMTTLNHEENRKEKSLLLERLRALENENSSLVLENETQRDQYERCLDEVANQVVQALLMQKDLRSECIKLQNRVHDLEQQNRMLNMMFEKERQMHTNRDSSSVQTYSSKRSRGKVGSGDHHSATNTENSINPTTSIAASQALYRIPGATGSNQSSPGSQQRTLNSKSIACRPALTRNDSISSIELNTHSMESLQSIHSNHNTYAYPSMSTMPHGKSSSSKNRALVNGDLYSYNQTDITSTRNAFSLDRYSNGNHGSLIKETSTMVDMFAHYGRPDRLYPQYNGAQQELAEERMYQASALRNGYLVSGAQNQNLSSEMPIKLRETFRQFHKESLQTESLIKSHVYIKPHDFMDNVQMTHSTKQSTQDIHVPVCNGQSADKYHLPFTRAPYETAQSVLKEIHDATANVKSFESLIASDSKPCKTPGNVPRLERSSENKSYESITTEESELKGLLDTNSSVLSNDSWDGGQDIPMLLGERIKLFHSMIDGQQVTQPLYNPRPNQEEPIAKGEFQSSNDSPSHCIDVERDCFKGQNSLNIDGYESSEVKTSKEKVFVSPWRRDTKAPMISSAEETNTSAFVPYTSVLKKVGVDDKSKCLRKGSQTVVSVEPSRRMPDQLDNVWSKSEGQGSNCLKSGDRSHDLAVKQSDEELIVDANVNVHENVQKQTQIETPSDRKSPHIDSDMDFVTKKELLLYMKKKREKESLKETISDKSQISYNSTTSRNLTSDYDDHKKHNDVKPEIVKQASLSETYSGSESLSVEEKRQLFRRFPRKSLKRKLDSDGEEKMLNPEKFPNSGQTFELINGATGKKPTRPKSESNLLSDSTSSTVFQFPPLDRAPEFKFTSEDVFWKDDSLLDPEPKDLTLLNLSPRLSLKSAPLRRTPCLILANGRNPDVEHVKEVKVQPNDSSHKVKVSTGYPCIPARTTLALASSKSLSVESLTSLNSVDSGGSANMSVRSSISRKSATPLSEFLSDSDDDLEDMTDFADLWKKRPVAPMKITEWKPSKTAEEVKLKVKRTNSGEKQIKENLTHVVDVSSNLKVDNSEAQWRTAFPLPNRTSSPELKCYNIHDETTGNGSDCKSGSDPGLQAKVVELSPVKVVDLPDKNGKVWNVADESSFDPSEIKDMGTEKSGKTDPKHVKENYNATSAKIEELRKTDLPNGEIQSLDDTVILTRPTTLFIPKTRPRTLRPYDYKMFLRDDCTGKPAIMYDVSHRGVEIKQTVKRSSTPGVVHTGNKKNIGKKQQTSNLTIINFDQNTGLRKNEPRPTLMRCVYHETENGKPVQLGAVSTNHFAMSIDDVPFIDDGSGQDSDSFKTPEDFAQAKKKRCPAAVARQNVSAVKQVSHAVSKVPIPIREETQPQFQTEINVLQKTSHKRRESDSHQENISVRVSAHPVHSFSDVDLRTDKTEVAKSKLSLSFDELSEKHTQTNGTWHEPDDEEPRVGSQEQLHDGKAVWGRIDIRDGCQAPIVNAELLEDFEGADMYDDDDIESAGEDPAQLDANERANLLDSFFQSDSDDSLSGSEDTDDSHPAEDAFLRLLGDKGNKRQVLRYSVSNRPSILDINLQDVFTRYEEKEKEAMSCFDFLDKLIEELEDDYTEPNENHLKNGNKISQTNIVVEDVICECESDDERKQYT